MKIASSTQSRFALLLLMAVAMMGLGCVRRRMMVRTNPPGAMVYVDKQLIGQSPASTSYTYYATREIEVTADGYRTERVLRDFSPPWYQYPGIDFFAETLWPFEIRDSRAIDIAMVPAQQINSDVLLANAQQLRMEASQGSATSPIPSRQLGNNYGQGPSVATPPAVPIPQPVSPPTTGTGWYPGQYLKNFLQPNGLSPTRQPEVGILPGGGYRPVIPDGGVSNPSF